VAEAESDVTLRCRKPHEIRRAIRDGTTVEVRVSGERLTVKARQTRAAHLVNLHVVSA